MRAVSELNYHPNLNARTLAGGKSRTVGMIASNLENPFFLDIFRALEAAAHKKGYEILVGNTDYNGEQMVKHVRLMIGRRVDGIALIVSELAPELLIEINRSSIPIVLFDSPPDFHNATNIRVHYQRSIERIVEYLYSLGHRRLAFIGHHSSLSPMSERERGFVLAVKRYGHGTEWRTVADQDGLEGGRQAARSLLRSGFKPTAIICVNDFMAVGAIRELRDQGFAIPEDISITGFDNIQLSEYCSPQLTTVHIPRERIGQLVFDSLVGDGAGKQPSRDIVIDPELVLRGSTGPAPA